MIELVFSVECLLDCAVSTCFSFFSVLLVTLVHCLMGLVGFLWTAGFLLG